MKSCTDCEAKKGAVDLAVILVTEMEKLSSEDLDAARATLERCRRDLLVHQASHHQADPGSPSVN